MSEGLVVTDLHKEYPTPAEPLRVLRGVSLRLASNESLAIVGPSGSGKSTLLNILATLDHPTRGSVMLDGTNPFTLDAKALARFRTQKVGLVFQDHHLLPQCTAMENVLIARLAAGRVSREDQQKAMQLLESVALADRATHFPSELSGGERQRVAIARALVNQPTLLLADEPTGNLDAATAGRIGGLLHDVARQSGAMLIAVTHSESLATTFGRVLRMHDGVLQQ